MLLGVHKSKMSPDLETLKTFKTFGGKYISKGNNYVYFISIIDFLTEYNYTKKTEYAIQSLIFGNTISAIPTDRYSKRFY